MHKTLAEKYREELNDPVSSNQTVKICYNLGRGANIFKHLRNRKKEH